MKKKLQLVEISVNQQSSLTDELQAAIAQIQTQSNKRNDCKHIGKEFSVFEATGDRTQNLEKLFQALNSVPPTSVEAERAFSAAGLFITKLRSKLSDRSIDCLCFLKSYFMTVCNCLRFFFKFLQAIPDSSIECFESHFTFFYLLCLESWA